MTYAQEKIIRLLKSRDGMMNAEDFMKELMDDKIVFEYVVSSILDNSLNELVQFDGEVIMFRSGIKYTPIHSLYEVLKKKNDIIHINISRILLLCFILIFSVFIGFISAFYFVSTPITNVIELNCKDFKQLLYDD